MYAKSTTLVLQEPKSQSLNLLLLRRTFSIFKSLWAIAGLIEWRALTPLKRFVSWNLKNKLLANFSHNKDDLLFAESAGFVLGHQVKDTSISAKLKKDVNIVAAIFVIHVGIENLEKVGVIREGTLGGIRYWYTQGRYKIIYFIFGGLDSFRTLFLRMRFG